MSGRGRPFAIGVSGNPGGKPKMAEVSALARRYTVDAIRGLVAVARLEPSKHDTAVTAASKALLDLGYPGHQKAGFGESEGGNVLHLHLLAVSAAGAVPVAIEAQEQLGHALEADEISPELQALIDGEMFPEAGEEMPHEALPLWDAGAKNRAQIEGNTVSGAPPAIGFGK